VNAYLWIAVGGALGSMGRFALTNLVAAWFGEDFPVGTLAINIAGSFVIGFFGMLTGPDGRIVPAPGLREFVMVGLCGGFTTFSAFSYQTLTLARQGELAAAGLNIAGSVVLCLLAVWLGVAAAGSLGATRGGGT
jgi:CrcB protein